jgi:RNAse E (EC 3.1.4.-)
VVEKFKIATRIVPEAAPIRRQWLLMDDDEDDDLIIETPD